MKVFVFDLLAYGENLDHLKVGNELPYPLSTRHFKPEVAVRTYAEHLDAWEEIDRLGYDGVGFNEHHCSPYGLMNSPNLMAAVRGAAHQAAEAADLRQPAAAARAAAAGRRAGDARLPVERPADLRFRPRHPARIPGAQRAAGRIARALRGGLRDRHPRLDRGRVLLRGQVLVLQGRRDLAAAGAAAASAGSGCRSSAARNRSSSPAEHNIRITPGLAPRRAAGRHHPLLRQVPGRARPPHHARPPVARPSRLCRRQQGAGGEGDAGPITSISTARCSATATSPRPALQRAGRLLSRRSTDYVRPENLRAAAACCARISAT